ncbi:hypothetical protein ACFU5O_23195 [Streptomyces sp. NPDC057445]|uniref:hypothetical protein n=1 Tax=Streptomyces sp. NPDC057445 TaxID=3346136 RepID=UPI00367F0AC2
MTSGDGPIMKGLPDGGAELSVVLRLGWDDVAALGREASRLAEQRGGPVSLDEAASHRLRTWSSVSKTTDDRAAQAQAQVTSPVPTTAAIAGNPAARVTSISPPPARQVQPTATAVGQAQA